MSRPTPDAFPSDAPTPGTPVTTGVIFQCHDWTPDTAQRYLRLAGDVDPGWACHVVLDVSRRDTRLQWARTMEAARNAGDLFAFDVHGLRKSIGYPYLRRGIVPGSSHFPTLLFSRQRPEDHFWMIESDVEYRGHWQTLVRPYAGRDDDLLCTHLQRYWRWPNWHWWTSLTPPAGQPAIDPHARLKAFLTAYRVSARALAHIDRQHLAGWRGHPEVLMPTLLAQAGYRIADLNDAPVPCYFGDDQNPNHNPERQSTLRWRPAISREEFTTRMPGTSLLFHPVKDPWFFDGERIIDTAEESAG